MRYGKFCTLVLFIISLVTYSFAQTDTTMGEATVVNKSRSLQFHLYGGYSLSYQHWTSPTAAIRYSADVALGLSRSDEDGSSGYESGNSTGRSKDNRTVDANSQVLNFSTYFLYPMYETGNLHSFAGFGPTVSFSHSFTKYETELASLGSSTTYISVSEHSNYSYGFGATGVAGIEYSITETFSMLAEYRVRATYNWSKATSETKSLSSNSRNFWESKGSTWSFTWESIRLGVGLYF